MSLIVPIYCLEPLVIRELPITNPDNPFGKPSQPEDDSTGMAIWPASIILSRWILQLRRENPSVFKDKVVAELGAGCSLPAIVTAVYGDPSRVYITDIHPPALDNAIFNLLNNGFEALPPPLIEDKALSCAMKSFASSSCRAYVMAVNWADPATYPDEQVDIVLGSDLIYDSAALEVFVAAVDGILKSGGLKYRLLLLNNYAC